MEKLKTSTKIEENSRGSNIGQYSSVEKLSPRKIKLRIYLVDNEFKTINMEVGSKVSDALEALSTKMNIEDIENFGIFEE